MNNPNNPMARQNGIVVQEMPDEVLVYDLDSNKAHCLNQSAALVWKSCDGTNTVGDIVKQFDGKVTEVVNGGYRVTMVHGSCSSRCIRLAKLHAYARTISETMMYAAYM